MSRSAPREKCELVHAFPPLTVSKVNPTYKLIKSFRQIETDSRIVRARAIALVTPNRERSTFKTRYPDRRIVLLYNVSNHIRGMVQAEIEKVVLPQPVPQRQAAKAWKLGRVEIERGVSSFVEVANIEMLKSFEIR